MQIFFFGESVYTKERGLKIFGVSNFLWVLFFGCSFLWIFETQFVFLHRGYKSRFVCLQKYRGIIWNHFSATTGAPTTFTNATAGMGPTRSTSGPNFSTTRIKFDPVESTRRDFFRYGELISILELWDRNQTLNIYKTTSLARFSKKVGGWNMSTGLWRNFIF